MTQSVLAPTYTVVTCHFGDPFWMSHTLRQLDRWSDDRVRAVVVVDQNRTDRSLLQQLPRVTEVLEFEPDSRFVNALGHDHPAALNRALRSIQFATTHVIVLDSDCFPVNASWLDRLDDVTLAASSSYSGLTHPCFMAFPVRFASVVDFGEAVCELGADTGRLVGVQLLRSGTQPVLAVAASVRAFGNTRGHWFLDHSLYHHQSASFASSSDRRLNSQVVGYLEAIYRRRVAAGEFGPSLLISGIRMMRRLGSRVMRPFRSTARRVRALRRA